MIDFKQSYKGIFKGISVFGGVQVFIIIISIVRSKFIAIFLGPTGMGIVGIFSSTIAFLYGLTSFGLGISAVKDIAAAESMGNQSRISILIISLKRWMWITGIFGTVVTFFLSPLLSKWSFGNYDYTIAYLLLSITILFSQLNSGHSVILQGMRNLNYLAKSNLYGNLFALFIVIPIYYFLKLEGIVLAIISTSFISLLVSQYFAKKIKIPALKVSKLRTLAEGKNMLKIGFVISTSNLMILGVAYLVRIYIGSKGGLIDVGLFTAGFSIISTYTGMIFNAMLTDYLPRISSVSKDNILCKQIINQQAEIALLVIGPILIFFIIFIKWIIILFYSNQFLPIENMMYWATIAIFFKLIAWCIGFIVIAKGASKLFFLSELVGNIYSLIFSLYGYHYWGLTGLGVASLFSFFLLTLQIYLIAKIKYEFGFNPKIYYIFILYFSLAMLCFITTKILNTNWLYLTASIIFFISVLVSIYELDKRVAIKTFIISYFQKKKITNLN